MRAEGAAQPGAVTGVVEVRLGLALRLQPGRLDEAAPVRPAPAQLGLDVIRVVRRFCAELPPQVLGQPRRGGADEALEGLDILTDVTQDAEARIAEEGGHLRRQGPQPRTLAAADPGVGAGVLRVAQQELPRRVPGGLAQAGRVCAGWLRPAAHAHLGQPVAIAEVDVEGLRVGLARRRGQARAVQHLQAQPGRGRALAVCGTPAPGQLIEHARDPGGRLLEYRRAGRVQRQHPLQDLVAEALAPVARRARAGVAQEARGAHRRAGTERGRLLTQDVEQVLPDVQPLQAAVGEAQMRRERRGRARGGAAAAAAVRGRRGWQPLQQAVERVASWDRRMLRVALRAVVEADQQVPHAGQARGLQHQGLDVRGVQRGAGRAGHRGGPHAAPPAPRVISRVSRRG